MQRFVASTSVCALYYAKYTHELWVQARGFERVNFMVFCGQCGLHLPSGTTRCPRCGAIANTTSDAGVDTFPTDAPTVASLTYAQRPQADTYSNAPHASPSFTPSEQQKLVLGPGSGGYDVVGDNEPTSALNAADYRTRTPVDFHTNTPYANVPDHAGYPIQAGNTYQNGGSTPANYGYGGHVPPGGATPAVYPLSPPTQSKKRRTVPLLVALLGLLLILGVSSFFVVERLHLLSPTGGTNGGVTTPASPIEQARGVVQQYYTDVNNKNYQDAYSLWKWGANAPSFATFENGYANTEHDALTVRNATEQSDATIKVLLTIVATERINGGTQQHTYTGYYIVGQDAGNWKILRGVLNRVA